MDRDRANAIEPAVADPDYAPGRRRIVRRARVDCYWVASRAAVKAGYEPETVRLVDDSGLPAATPEIAAYCRRLQAEMLEFLSGTARGGRWPNLTVGWVIEKYRADPESRYRAVRTNTRIFYDNALAIVLETVGLRRIDSVTASAVRAWHRGWSRAGANPRRGYACVQALRVALKYGKGERLRGCAELSDILGEAEFPTSRGRRIAMSEAQARALIAKAHELGHASVARALALQFGCALRQKDVIGEWSAGRWSAGLMWGEHVKADWTLIKPTSKSNFQESAEFDLREIPIALAEMQRAPPLARIGPVILDEATGKPWRQRKFARTFRDIARAAGIPDEVYNMDARAGAVTDAYRHGAPATDVMDLATHANLQTSRRYDRARMDATTRVSRRRFGPSNAESNK